MSVLSILYYVYAALLLLGGLLGFLRARSAASLGASAVATILVAVASVLLHHHPRIALSLGMLVSLILAVFFFGRYRESKKPMPAMPIMVFSAIVLIASIVRWAGVKF